MATVKYTVNGVDFKTYGVYVSEGKGMMDGLKMKTPQSVDWPDCHGKIVDLQAKRFEERTITLECFLKAAGETDFISKLKTFLDLFNTDGTQRLHLEIDTAVLPFEVYCGDGITVKKKWRSDVMTGEFTLKLTEPDPVKRVVRHQRAGEATKTLTVTLTSAKAVSVHWGDGTKNMDVYGENITVTHNYTANGIYFAVISGVIEEITNFSTNGTLVWNKL